MVSHKKLLANQHSPSDSKVLHAMPYQVRSFKYYLNDLNIRYLTYKRKTNMLMLLMKNMSDVANNKYQILISPIIARCVSATQG